MKTGVTLMTICIWEYGLGYFRGTLICYGVQGVSSQLASREE
jgi:hypothetical protein